MGLGQKLLGKMTSCHLLLANHMMVLVFHSIKMKMLGNSTPLLKEIFCSFSNTIVNFCILFVDGKMDTLDFQLSAISISQRQGQPVSDLTNLR